MRNRLRRRSRHFPRTSPISIACRGWPTRTRLVLLDELGSSTDPEEGSALAVAVASIFLTAGAWSLISTHHTSLKVYAANTPGVLNAAAGVDEVTLVPNYQLRLGVPGASAGIQTAERLGLNGGIIVAARQRLGSQQVDIARFLDRLHKELTPTRRRAQGRARAAVRAQPGTRKTGARRRCRTAQPHSRA